MKKNNKNGFTLVELVVVLALMTIIMGAVLSILTPINNFYQKVNNTTHQEAACINIGDVLSDKTKYAKTISIVCSDDLSDAPTGFPHLITIANDDLRPGATGMAQHCHCMITESNATTSKTLSNFDINNNASYRINVDEYSNTSKNYVKLNFEAMPMRVSGGTYVENTDVVYRYSKAIEFTNINNRNMLPDAIKNDCSFSCTTYSGSNTYPKYVFIAYRNPDE